jgi:hypothetical protein
MILYLSALIASIVLDAKTGIRRPLLIVSFPLLVADCALNYAFGGSFRNTLSGESWHHRQHKYWSWCYRCVNGMFFWQKDEHGNRIHCQRQALKEAAYGSFWKALAADWRGELRQHR